MSARLTIYSGPLSMFGAKVQIAALEKGLDFDLVMVPVRLGTRLRPEAPGSAAHQPQAPGAGAGARRGRDFRLHADLRIPGRHGADAAAVAARPRWRAPMHADLEHQSDEVYFPHIIRLDGPAGCAGRPSLRSPPSTARIASTRDDGATAGIEEWLAGSYSFADIAFYMAALFGERQSAPLTASTPRLLAWRERMAQRAPVNTVVSAMAAWLQQCGPAGAGVHGIPIQCDTE